MSLTGALAGLLLTFAAPGAVPSRHAIVYAPGDRGRLDVYLPPHAAPGAPIAVFIYGGTWQSGARGFYRFVGATLASRGIVTVIPDYRLYPEVRFPDFLRDNASAVRWARDHAAELGADPTRLFLAGHSAGAYNAVMLAVDRRWLGEVGLDPRHDIAGVIGWAGPYDFLPLTDEKLKAIFGPPDQLAATQPITYAAADRPPLLLLAGSADKEVDPGNSTRMAAAVKAKGGDAEAKIYPGIGHAGILGAILEAFRRQAPTLADTVSFIFGHRAASAIDARDAA
jgi:acetyl esterase/lipase